VTMGKPSDTYALVARTCPLLALVGLLGEGIAVSNLISPFLLDRQIVAEKREAYRIHK
jgi:hypothetical protein